MIKYFRRIASTSITSEILFLILLFFLLSSFSKLALAEENAEKTGMVYVVEVRGIIGPGTREYITGAINLAERENAEALIILIDTPGGLYDDTREIVKAMLNSKVVTVAYVYPSGARAASAGSFILLASNIAAMSPGTSVGAAHPVLSGFGEVEVSKEMREKILNDAVSYIRAIAEQRERNATLATEFVEKSRSITETEAVENGIANLIASSIDELLLKINGMEINGRTLKTENARIIKIEKNEKSSLLDAVSNPNLAYILLAIAIYGIIFELSNPGAILPGIAGSIALILALAGFSTISINIAGALLILLAIILFILELKITSYGMLSIAGFISFILGSILLVDVEKEPFLRISFSIIIVIALLTVAFFVFALAKVAEVHRRKSETGKYALVGETCIAKERITETEQGMVLIRGELWNARTKKGEIKKEEKAKVVGIENSTLIIEKL